MLKEKALRTIKAEFKEYNVEDWQNMQEWIKECLEKEGELL